MALSTFAEKPLISENQNATSAQSMPLATVKFTPMGGELDDRRGIWGSNQETQEVKSNLSRETCRGKQS